MLKAQPTKQSLSLHDSQVLLTIAQILPPCRDIDEMVRLLARELSKTVAFDDLSLSVWDAGTGAFRLRVSSQSDVPDHTPPMEFSASGPAGTAFETGQPIIIRDARNETRFASATAMMRNAGWFGLCHWPLVSRQRRLGTLNLATRTSLDCDSREIELLGKVAQLVAVAVQNAIDFDAVNSRRVELEGDRDRLRMLLSVNNVLVSNLDLQALFRSLASSIRRVLGHKRTTLALYDEQIGNLIPFAIETSSGEVSTLPPLPPPNAPPLRAFQARRTMVFNEDDLAEPAAEVIRAAGIREYCSVPLIVRERVLGTLSVGSTELETFGAATVAMVEAVARQVAIAVDNALAFQKIEQLNGQLSAKASYLEGEIRSEHGFESIVGDSGALRQVLKEVEVVAPTDSTVLILGETGTGKELIARAIHERSRRCDRTFVKINCAAIPTGLLESELFGHEKGAFTGAIGQKLGRFEVANGGTLFLDEVGDIPLELQAKLLRVLQEQEFERIGGNKTIRVDVRLIGATNRDLAEMVEQHGFRADLYYRLNVFPIRVPPLRERSEDIPSLVRHFTREFARRMHKQIDQIAPQTLARLEAYLWPGNVRELANLIERGAILSRGPVLEVPLGELERRIGAKVVERAVRAVEPDQSRILEALRESNWVLGGPNGAAARLGMKRTTLQSRLRKLGITRLT